MARKYKYNDYNGSNLTVSTPYSHQGKPHDTVIYTYDSFKVIIVGVLLLLSFFLVALGHNTNPFDMAFGDGNGNGGFLNIISDYGNSMSSFIVNSTATFRSWGLIDNPNGWLSILGSLLNVSVVIINILVQTLVFAFRLVIFCLTGGQVVL